ncbi:hypothetical protein [Flavobacterium sp.]|jgi:hypothetical protein|uniref:hypothetical protein n=1 Tax=Flavobacterium sp. TaxID=239 RepID=UPI0037BF528D
MRHAVMLDTGPVASGYPDGSVIHLSSTHFQYARPTFRSSRLGCIYTIKLFDW